MPMPGLFFASPGGWWPGGWVAFAGHFHSNGGGGGGDWPVSGGFVIHFAKILDGGAGNHPKLQKSSKSPG